MTKVVTKHTTYAENAPERENIFYVTRYIGKKHPSKRKWKKNQREIKHRKQCENREKFLRPKIASKATRRKTNWVIKTMEVNVELRKFISGTTVENAICGTTRFTEKRGIENHTQLDLSEEIRSIFERDIVIHSLLSEKIKQAIFNGYEHFIVLLKYRLSKLSYQNFIRGYSDEIKKLILVENKSCSEWEKH